MFSTRLLLGAVFMCFLAYNANAGAVAFTVPTGYVGVFYKFKELISDIAKPGDIHFYNPLITSYKIVDVMSQTDYLPPVDCVTGDRQTLKFLNVAITNQLPEDAVIKVLKTYEKQGIVEYDTPLITAPAINFLKEKCSTMTGEELRSTKYSQLNEMLLDFLQEYQENRPELNGESTKIKILRVFIDIPKLSPEVEANYQKIATEKTAEEAERYRQLTLLKEKETRNKVEILEAEKVRDVAILKNQELISKEEADAKIAKIRAESAAEQKRMNADAESYAAHKKAQDNQLLLTKEYLQIKQLEYYGCQNTIHYGDVPKFLQIAPLQGGVPVAASAAA
jgi:regulator of protease activity HflC (stomatin/prohibitin superfamily)